jgi:nitroreductase
LDVLETVRERRSIQSYQDKPIPREIIETILEAAQLTPSARNIEPWHFIVVTNAEKRKALSGGQWAKFLTQPPVVIVACGEKKLHQNGMPLTLP